MVALLVLGGLMAAPQSHAQGRAYLGGSVGSSDFDDGNAIPVLITSGDVDGSDNGFKLFGGYQFNPNFAAELAWVDLGTARYGGTFGPFTVTGGTLDTSGLSVSAVGILPLSPSFDLLGKVGLFAWEARARDTTGGAPFEGKDDGTDVSVGVGAAFNINRNVSIRLEWERFEAIDGIDLLSLGAAFKF